MQLDSFFRGFLRQTFGWLTGKLFIGKYKSKCWLFLKSLILRREINLRVYLFEAKRHIDRTNVYFSKYFGFWINFGILKYCYKFVSPFASIKHTSNRRNEWSEFKFDGQMRNNVCVFLSLRVFVVFLYYECNAQASPFRESYTLATIFVFLLFFFHVITSNRELHEVKKMNLAASRSNWTESP